MDISNASSIHVNILTHLEKQRVEFLLSTGLPFDSAKKIAQANVLNIFRFSSSGVKNSEYLDISDSSNGDAILLAVSSILQGFRTESELSSLLASISNDIRPDGILNDSSIMSSLIDHALLLDTVAIRANVSNFYMNHGTSASIPDFEKFIKLFIDSSTFTRTNSVITFPATGAFGNNFLSKDQLIYTGTEFSFAGAMKKCNHLLIRMHMVSGDYWSYYSGSEHNLSITTYDQVTHDQFFTVIDPDLPFDLHITTLNGGTYLIEYYEINSSTPSFTKTITVS